MLDNFEIYYGSDEGIYLKCLLCRWERGLDNMLLFTLVGWAEEHKCEKTKYLGDTARHSNIFEKRESQ